MAFTTPDRIRALIGDSGVGFHNAPTVTALANVAVSANAILENLGVPSTETDLGLLYAADQLALSMLMTGQLARMMVRGEAQAVGSFRLAADSLRKDAITQALAYVEELPRSSTYDVDTDTAVEHIFTRGDVESWRLPEEMTTLDDDISERL